MIFIHTHFRVQKIGFNAHITQDANLLTMPSTPNIEFYKPLKNTIRSLELQFDTILDERKALLKQLTEFISNKIKSDKKIELIFICTHNSRRSHISQLWHRPLLLSTE